MQPSIGIDPTVAYTAAEVTAGRVPYGFGQRGLDRLGNEYVFVRSDATGITDRFAAYINTNVGGALQWVASMITTTNAAPGVDGGAFGCMVGAPQGAVVQSTNVSGIPASGAGWLLIRGFGTLRVLASCVRTTRLNTTATAGALDDDGGVGSREVRGVVLNVTNGGAAANVAATFSYPLVVATL